MKPAMARERVTRPRVVVEPETVVSGGVRLAAYSFGGSGSPLMLVHATGFHAHVWLPWLASLRERFTVFAFDLRGHGESETPVLPDAYHYRRMGEDVLAVADHFSLGRFAALGHSVGGALIVWAELTRPGTVTRAVLFEPIILPPDQKEETAAAQAARTRRTVFASTTEMLHRWSRRGPFATFDPDALRAYVENGVRDCDDGAVELKCSREAEVATFLQDTESGLWGELERYRTPTLILAGERSTSRVLAVIPAQAGLMPNARAEIRPDLSHFLPFEQPHDMAARAIDFLATPLA